MKDFHFDAEFEGIDITLVDEDRDVLEAAVKGTGNFSFILSTFSSSPHPSTRHPSTYIAEFSLSPYI